MVPVQAAENPKRQRTRARLVERTIVKPVQIIAEADASDFFERQFRPLPQEPAKPGLEEAYETVQRHLQHGQASDRDAAVIDQRDQTRCSLRGGLQRGLRQWRL